jgi:maltooligosyltrehalose trehalohydrolase
MKAGTEYLENGQCSFTVWAPEKDTATLHIVSPNEQFLEMNKTEEGYFHLKLEKIPPGATYFYRLNAGQDLPDPASHFQPEGVHAPSQVINHKAYQWQDAKWKGLELKDLIIYELHVGTFTKEGTFRAMIDRLPDLADTGINAIEIMPVSQFPGNRNWGYDGVHPYSVQNSYGTPDDFKALIDACHAQGIAVILDLVYNHLGPEGNYFTQFGPYFTDAYKTPWGSAINFDGDYSDGVRDFFAENALFWFENYHLDGLRLDAIHTVYDNGAIHFWEYTTEKVKELSKRTGRNLYLIAESDLNSPKVINSPHIGGYGFNAQWLDDFHHALYVLLDKKGQQYFADFGAMEQLCKAIEKGFVLSGEYVQFRKRKYGRSSAGVPGDKFIVFSQNHDQIGNRMLGERLSILIPFEALKLAAAAVILSPYIPMLFMGEEYGEENPFLYFISHLEPELIKAVQEGRKNDFAKFHFEGNPPDPQAEQTFQSSKLQWHKRSAGKHQVLLSWYKELIRLRKTYPALYQFDKSGVQAHVVHDTILLVRRQYGNQACIGLYNFSDSSAIYTVEEPYHTWKKLLDSCEQQWQNPEGNAQFSGKGLPEEIFTRNELALQPWSLVLYGNEGL